MVSSAQVNQSDSKLLPKAFPIPHLQSPLGRKLILFFIGLTSCWFEFPTSNMKECNREALTQVQEERWAAEKVERSCFRKQWESTPMCTLENFIKWLAVFVSL